MTEEGIFWDRKRCVNCLACASACKITHARKVCGTEYTVPELLELIEKDSVYFRRSRGGVTVGGGEPMLQAEFVRELMRACHQELSINTAVETSSFASWEKARMVYEHTDVIQTDIKHMDDARHRELTRVSNRPILANIRGAAETLDPRRQTLVIRVPVIPGMNDSEENIVATAKFVRSLKRVERMELLPYHSLGEAKYQSVADAGDYQLHGLKPEKDEYMDELRKKAETCGVKVRLIQQHMEKL